MIKEEDVIVVGDSTRAVICRVYHQEKVEAVYFQNNSEKYIAETFIMIDGKWQFEALGPNGVYAEKSDRLFKFIQILKSSYNDQ